MNVHEFAELSAGHALDSLSPADEAAFQEAAAQHPEWSAIVEADAATAARLAEGVAGIHPPRRVRSTLLSRIAPDPIFDQAPDVPPTAIPPAEPAEPSEGPVQPLEADAPPSVEPPPTTDVIQTVARRTWTRGLLALAASFILLVALGTVAVSIGDRLRAPAEVVALDEIQAASDGQTATVELEDGGTATAHWSDSVGKAVLVTDGLEPTAAAETYELWFVRDDGAVSAGLFQTDDEGAATTLLDGQVEEGDVIAVTVEPEGGSPTGEPSSAPIFTIPTG